MNGKRIQKIIQVGGSSGIIIPDEFMKRYGYRRGDLVEVFYSSDLVVIKPVRASEIEEAVCAGLEAVEKRAEGAKDGEVEA